MKGTEMTDPRLNKDVLPCDGWNEDDDVIHGMVEVDTTETPVPSTEYMYSVSHIS